MALYEFSPDDAGRFADFVHIRAKRVGDELVFRKCPFCGENSNDKDKFAINLKTGQYNCFRASCGARGNMITLSRTFGFELPGYADEYYNTRKRYVRFPQKERPRVTDPAIEYMKSRGISEAVTRRYEITTDSKNPDVICFPFYDENNVLQLVKYRNTKATKENGMTKEWSFRDRTNDLSCKPILFGMNHCNPNVEDGTLIITEGQIDSLSVAEAGFQNVVSVPTGANGFTWVPYCWNFLQQFRKLIVFGDYEHDRIPLLDDMRKFFNREVLHVSEESYHDCKDANEILQKYGKEEIQYCIADAVPVMNKNIVRLSDIRPRPISDMECFQTGIGKLDRILGGFYFGQLVILTGERGEGKSTLANQFALFAVKSGVKSFIYSGELPNGSLRDWMDHQAAGPRHLIEKANQYGDLEYDLTQDVGNKISEWYKDYLWIYQNQFLEDDESEEEQTVVELITEAARQGFRFIVIDNLMTAMDDDARYDLYRAQTKFVKQLVRIAKARDILIVLVAHQRKNQGTNRTADDVAGSANITNLADIVMTFGRPKPDEDNPPTWDREIRIQKNRLTGRLGYPVHVWFDHGSRRVSDEQNNFGWELGWETNDFSEIGDIPNPFEEVII